MQLIPKKNQWKKWSLPSKLTALGVYLAVIPIALAIFSTAGNAIYDFLETHYSVQTKILSNELFKEYTGKNMAEDELDIDVSYPEITSLIHNPIFQQTNREIVASIVSNLKPNLIDLKSTYTITLQSDRVLSITFETYSFYQNAFNGDGSYGSINIDLKNKQFIEFFDIFDVRKRPLNAIKRILRERIDQGCIIENQLSSEQYIPRFSLSENNIVFLLSEYEITVGACGHSTIETPYDTVSSYIRKDGPLGTKFESSANWDGREHKKNTIGIYY